eukprot:GILJ01015456.1.p1 GENE.GILJ01015456.1~~GILJ01015456.1.p1  ORF type:complete len:208 (-),score=16.90 GILJ01015456.1:101-724(-)
MVSGICTTDAPVEHLCDNMTCPDGQYCWQAKCFDPNDTCMHHSCPVNQLCRQGVCVNDAIPCAKTADCPSRYTCHQGFCDMEELVCQRLADCPIGFECSKGHCIEHSALFVCGGRDNSVCPPGYHCRNSTSSEWGMCSPNEQQPLSQPVSTSISATASLGADTTDTSSSSLPHVFGSTVMSSSAANGAGYISSYIALLLVPLYVCIS